MKLAIFDKDGTLTAPKSGAKFVQHPEDQVLLPGVAEGIAALKADGWVMAIASNQGGVAAGYKSLEDAIAELRYCLSLLRENGINTLEMISYFCPDVEGDKCGIVKGDTNYYPFRWRDNHLKEVSYRKPFPGMIQAAIEEYRPFTSSLDWHKENVLFIGDRSEDQEAAAAAGVAFQWADEWRAPYA